MNVVPRLRLAARRTFFGWWIVASAIGVQILVAGLVMQAFGTYVAVWQAEFGWSKTAFAAAFALQRGLQALLSPAQGWLLQRFGTRRVVRFGLLVLALGFVLLARFETQIGFYLAYLVIALGAGLSGFLSLTTVIVQWFRRYRSSALALMQVGISVGGLIVPFVAWLLTTQGWRTTAWISAGAILALGLPLSSLIRSSPEAYGLLPDGDDDNCEETRTGSAAASAEPSFGTREAIRTRAFWLITAGHSIAVTLVASLTVHIVLHLTEGLGFTIQAAASIVALMTGATMIGQLAGGFLGDRFSKRAIAIVAMWAHAAALLALAFAPSLGFVVAFAIVHGLAWGMRGPTMQALRADYFGRRSFATILGFSISFVMLGQMIGPLVIGAMADALGDYRLAFTGLAVLVVAGSGFFLALRPPVRKRRRSSTP